MLSLSSADGGSSCLTLTGDLQLEQVGAGGGPGGALMGSLTCASMSAPF